MMEICRNIASNKILTNLLEEGFEHVRPEERDGIAIYRKCK